MQKNFYGIKKICADLNLWATDPKFLHVVDNYMAYNLQKYHIDSSQIEISMSFFNSADIVVYNLWKFQIKSLQIEISTTFSLVFENYSTFWISGLNFNAINLKFLQIVDKYLTYNQMDSITSKLRPNRSKMQKNFCRIKKIHTDLNLWAINLKFLQIVCHIIVYNMKKLQISSSQIEISTNFLYSAKILLHFGSIRPPFWCYQSEIFIDYR